MAIYSCAVSTVGRSTHAAGTAGAHLRYIGRVGAASEVETAHMPAQPEQARAWMDGQEREARKNARLCSKIRIALPRELTHDQNATLVRGFLTELGGGRVPWFYAIHDRGRDAHNPHAHVVLIDRDVETGKRVLLLSDSPKDRQKAGLPSNGVEWIRERWERSANQALARAGHDARIDRRSLAAQGIDREPTIHLGPRGQHVDRAVKRPESKIVPAPTARHPGRVIDYPMIDAGRTRRERNAEIVDLNLERAARSPDFETRAWALFECDQRAKDRPVEAQAVASARRRTLEERRLREGFKARLKETRARRDAEAALSRDWTRQQASADIAALQARQAGELGRVRQQQGKLLARFIATIDVSGRARRKRQATIEAIRQQHRQERRELAEEVRQARVSQAEAVQARYRPAIDGIKLERRQQVGVLKERQRDEQYRDDRLLQAREAEREHDRDAMRQRIDEWKKMQRQAGDRQAEVASRLGVEWQGKDDAPAQERTTTQRTEEVRRRLDGEGGPSPAGPGRARRIRRS